MIKDLFKKRVVVLGTVFGVLLLTWYMTVPIKIKDCSVGNIQYAHKFFNMCSDKIIYIHPSYSALYNYGIAYNDERNKRYTRYNIAGHITNWREANNHPYWFINSPNSFWINTLITIGHYDEAKDYLKYFPKKYDNFSLLNSFMKEECYGDEIFGKSRRIGILACQLKSPATALLAKKEMNEVYEEYNKNYVDDMFKFISNAKKDIIKFKKTANPHTKKIGLTYEAIEKGQFNLAEKYLNEYCSVNTCNNAGKIKFNLKLGIAYMDKQNYKKAIECFNKILEIQDYNYKAHEKLEICYRKLGNIQKANEHARIMKELLAL